MLSGVLASNALLGLLLAAIVIRADWRRRGNQLLALACTLDAAVTGTMSAAVATGMAVTSPLLVHLCNVGRVAIVHPTLEFTYAFPLERRPPPAVRFGGLVATAVALWLALSPPTRDWFATWSNLCFFAPYFVVTSAVLLRNVRLTRGSGDAAGTRAILGALAFRWSAEFVTYLFVRPLWPGFFPAAFTFDATAAPLAGYVVIAYAVLRYRFFRVRGLVAEAVLYGSLALSVLVSLGVSIELALARLHEPLALRVALTLLALVPFGVFVVVRRYTPRIEDTLLARFDPRRAVRKATLESVLRETATLVEPEAVTRATCAALASLSGGSVVFLHAAGSASEPALSPALTRYLTTSETISFHAADGQGAAPEVADELRALHADLVVPARSEARLVGALVVQGGVVDQDTTTAAGALASHLASKLAHHALYRHSFELERRLDDAKRLAELGTFAAAIAHDIRTPLSSVRMNVQMLRASASLPPSDVECADIALEELARMARYVSEILDYSKPVPLELVAADVSELVERAARGIEPALAAQGLSLSCLPLGAPARVRIDVNRFRQILENLLENAANASARGGEIRVEARACGEGRVALDVIDQGRGIPEADLPHVFEPFFTRRSDGTGLGLAIVKKLVVAHGGELLVRSTSGVGTVFTIVLPTVAVGDAAEG